MDVSLVWGGGGWRRGGGGVEEEGRGKMVIGWY